jgi:nucleoside 2-deoxyribosyltransferase
MKVYLAGPEVFLSDAVEIGRRKKDICAQHGVVGLFPLDGGIDGSAAGDGAADRGVPASLLIFRHCVAMMEAADAVIANLTPFRGASADAGTIYELGYMAARRKLCTGYSNVPGGYADRVESLPKALPDGRLIRVDRDGNEVEDFGLADNLMIAHALDSFGHPLLTPRVAPADRWRDLALFEECARRIATRNADVD